MSEIKEKPDRRVKRTRQAIRDALIALIRDKGFEAVTVQEIVERADVNRSTFYFHFQDKYDLLEQSNREMLDAFAASLQEPRDTPPPCRLANMDSATKHFEHIAANAAYYKVMLREMGIPDFANRLKLAIAEAFYQKLDLMLTDEHGVTIPRDIQCAYVASAHFGLIEWWLENDLMYSPSYMVNALNQLVKFGPVRAAGF